MIAYNGGSISNYIKNHTERDMYVTDIMQRAVRYANAQATGLVDPDMNLDQAEGTIILEVEVDDTPFLRRPENHSSLDTAELWVSKFRVVKAYVRFSQYSNTLYGNRHTGYFRKDDVLELLQTQQIEIQIIE